MNSQTKQRYISTSIWSDDWFDSLSEREKLVYFYLLTNEHTNAAGVYQCTLKNVRLEIGISREEIEQIMAKFSEAGKAFYYREYIIIPKWLKHQKIKERSGLFMGAARVLKSLPDDIKAFISERKHYDYDISGIIGKVSTLTKDPPETHPPKNIDPPPENGTPTQDPPLKNGGGSIVPPPQSTLQKAHDSDSDLDSDSDSDLDLDLDLDVVVNEQRQNTQKTTTATFSSIQKEAMSVGYFLTERQAAGFLVLDNSWLSGRYNFFVFAFQKIKDDPIYSKKPKNEQERIFAKGWKYQNWLQEYQDWAKRQIITDEQKALEYLRKTPPTECPKCKTAIDHGKCPVCNGFLYFNEETKMWEYQEPFDFSDGFENWKERFFRPKEQPPPEETEEELYF